VVTATLKLLVPCSRLRQQLILSIALIVIESPPEVVGDITYGHFYKLVGKEQAPICIASRALYTALTGTSRLFGLCPSPPKLPRGHRIGH
jgi:hypothetical protein